MANGKRKEKKTPEENSAEKIAATLAKLEKARDNNPDVAVKIGLYIEATPGKLLGIYRGLADKDIKPSSLWMKSGGKAVNKEALKADLQEYLQNRGMDHRDVLWETFGTRAKSKRALTDMFKPKIRDVKNNREVDNDYWLGEDYHYDTATAIAKYTGPKSED